jgi:hypothetical protein
MGVAGFRKAAMRETAGKAAEPSRALSPVAVPPAFALEQLHPLASKVEPGKAGDVAAGMREARGTTCPHRIFADRCGNDRDRRRGLLRDLRGDPAIGEDEVDRQPDQIGRHCRQSSVIPGSEPILERDIRAVDVAELAQSLTEGIERLRRW